MTAVVTGASGHLGGVLVRALMARGRTVRALYNSDRRALEGLSCECVRADIRDADAMRKAFAGAEVVYHFAAVISIAGDPSGKVQSTNVEGLRTVLNAAREVGVPKLVFCSSIESFDLGDGDQLLDERSPRTKSGIGSAYGDTKIVGEDEVRRAVDAGLDAVIVNPTGVIGPLDFKPSRMGQFFLDLAHRKLPGLVTGGFNWVDVRDVVDASIAAETRGRKGENYILGGRWAPLPMLAQMAKQCTGVRPPLMNVPMPVASAVAPLAEWFSRKLGREPAFTPDSIRILRAGRNISSAKAEVELGHRARPLEETVRDIYQWFTDAKMV